jgi:hypothetical protein
MNGAVRTVFAFALLLASLGAANAAPFRKGVSLQVFTFPAVSGDRYAGDPFPNRAGAAAYFDVARLHAMGFDHVRLPVDVGPLLDDPGRKVWSLFRGYFRDFVAELHRNRLGVIVTLVAPAISGQIPEDQLDGLAGERFRRYAELAERFAAELSGWNIDALALEPMNEPQQACVRSGAVDWIDYQAVLIPRLRAKAPRLWLGLTGGCWSKIEGLEHLRGDLLKDERTFVSVHFYDPFLFTHQGSDWTLDIMPVIAGLPYPATAGSLDAALAAARQRAAALPASRKAAASSLLPRAEDAVRQYFREDPGPVALGRRLDALQSWAGRNGVPPERVVVTEYGAMKTPGGEASRARWLRDVSGAVAARGWGSTLWVLRQGPFGLDDREGRLDPALLAAIGAKQP